MSNTYRIIADLHTHTLASTHAYSSVTEMIRAAADKGLYAIALTDHARTMPGSPREWYFSSLHELPLHYRGVMNLAGIEANVLDFEGHLDIEPRDIPRMDWVVASIHHLPLEGLQDPDVEKCTQLWLNVAKNPKVNVIAHSGDPVYAYDYEKVIPVFGENHKLVEINNHSFPGAETEYPQLQGHRPVLQKARGAHRGGLGRPLRDRGGGVQPGPGDALGDRFPRGADPQCLGPAPERLLNEIHRDL